MNYLNRRVGQSAGPLTDMGRREEPIETDTERLVDLMYPQHQLQSMPLEKIPINEPIRAGFRNGADHWITLVPVARGQLYAVEIDGARKDWEPRPALEMLMQAQAAICEGIGIDETMPRSDPNRVLGGNQ